MGKNGAFAQLLKNVLNAALEGEMEAHLDGHERDQVTVITGGSKSRYKHPWEKSPFLLAATGILRLGQSLSRKEKRFLLKMLPTEL